MLAIDKCLKGVVHEIAPASRKRKWPATLVRSPFITTYLCADY